VPKEISGLRIARSFLTPDIDNTVLERELDFQLGARQGIAIHSVHGEVRIESSTLTMSTATITLGNGVHSLHLETGSLETVPDESGDDEDTIDSEVFFRQGVTLGGNDDATTEFRASLAMLVSPQGPVDYPNPILTARNITHRAVMRTSVFDGLFNVTIFYTFVEFSLAELGLILARRT